MIRFQPGIPGPELGHRPMGARPAASSPHPPTPGLPPAAAGEATGGRAVILELSTSALKERMGLLLARFAPPGWAVLGIGHAQGLLAQALQERPAGSPVELVALAEGPGAVGLAARVIPAEALDAVLLDDDVMGLPGPERGRLIRHGLGMLRPGGRLLLVVSDAGPGLWAEGLTLQAPEPAAGAGEPSAPFGRAGLAILHRDGRDLGARACFEFVLETPWPPWIAALPAPIRGRHGRALWRLQRRMARLQRRMADLRAAWPRLRWRLIELLTGESEEGD